MIKKIQLGFVFGLFVLVANAQIFSTTYDAYQLTKYINPPQDTIYVFFGESGSNNKIGQLRAKDPEGLPATYSWEAFNFETYSFQAIENENDSILNNLSYGAYRVNVSNTNNTNSVFTAWVLIDTFNIKRIRVENTCQFLNLEAITEPSIYDPYVYYDISVDPPLEVLIDNTNAAMQDVQWESMEGVEIPFDKYINTTIENPPPLQDSRYAIYIRDVFGKEDWDTTSTIIGKAAYAKFDVQIKNEDGVFEEQTEYIGEAPMEIKLVNKSGNALFYKWLGYNDPVNVLLGKEKVLWESTEQEPETKTYFPGIYEVKLIVENEYDCIDSISIEGIKVDSSKIDHESIPNVFTPNDDQLNDVWIFSSFRNEDNGNLLSFTERSVVSVEELQVKIYNRWGVKVYDFKGLPEDWLGWDGTTSGLGIEAPEGIYNYVVKALGYDGRIFNDKIYTGQVFLFR